MKSPSEICALCTQPAELKVSHIIPKFVFRQMKKSSATGYFRSGINPDKRAQDGLKTRLLCDQCEQRLSSWERPFAEQVFAPLCDGKGFEPFVYGTWLTKFSVSISWRALQSLRQFGPITHLLGDSMRRLNEAESVWRSCLLEKRDFMSPYDQHLIPLGFVESPLPDGTPPNINRYFASAAAVDLVTSNHHTFVFTKLPFAVVVGIVQTTRPGEWFGTRLRPMGGTFGEGKRLQIPGVIHQYMCEKARRVSEIHRTISPRQREVMRECLLKDPERTIESMTFEATRRDVELFGKDAFSSQ